MLDYREIKLEKVPVSEVDLANQAAEIAGRILGTGKIRVKFFAETPPPENTEPGGRTIKTEEPVTGQACGFDGNQIWIRTGLGISSLVKTVFHEILHVYYYQKRPETAFKGSCPLIDQAIEKSCSIWEEAIARPEFWRKIKKRQVTWEEAQRRGPFV